MRAEPVRFIDTTDELDVLCEELAGSRWLTVDTEFVREKTYYPKFCLLQVANADTIACVDPLDIASLEPLLEVLYDPAITKVLHAAQQDLEIFYILRTSLPQPIFDTQVAAALLGHGEQLGYAALVEKLLGITVDKSDTRTDWSRRPLSDSQLQYAANDVRYLRDIYLQLNDTLQDRQRTDWVAEECALLGNPDNYHVDPHSAWQRVRGLNKLKGRELASLRELAAWRETEAMNSDRPRRWILQDAALIDLARREPGSTQELGGIKDLPKRTADRHGQAIVKAVQVAGETSPATWPQPKRREVDKAQRELTASLMKRVQSLAEANDIAPSMLANRNTLERLSNGETDLPLTRGWRADIVGDSLVELLDS